MVAVTVERPPLSAWKRPRKAGFALVVAVFDHLKAIYGCSTSLSPQMQLFIQPFDGLRMLPDGRPEEFVLD
jgi:hypothetical protein